MTNFIQIEDICVGMKLDVVNYKKYEGDEIFQPSLVSFEKSFKGHFIDEVLACERDGGGMRVLLVISGEHWVSFFDGYEPNKVALAT